MAIYKASKPTKDGRQYYFSVPKKDSQGNSIRLPNGNYDRFKSEKFKTEAQARKAERKFELEINGKALDSECTLKDVCHHWLEFEKRPFVSVTTMPKLERAVRYINNFFGNIKMRQLTISKYESWRTWLSNQPWQAEQKNKVDGELKQIIRYANEHYDIGITYLGRFRKFVPSDQELKDIEERVDYLTREEFDQLIANVDDVVYRSMYTLMFFQGLRPGEMNGLVWDCVDFETNEITIRQSVSTKYNTDNGYLVKSTKNRKTRVLPMFEEVRVAMLELKKYWQSMKQFKSSWYCFGGIKPLPESTMGKRFKDHLKKAGLRTTLHLHQLRHSCASMLIENNISSYKTSRFLGHANSQITERVYVHMYKNSLIDVVKEIENK